MAPMRSSARRLFNALAVAGTGSVLFDGIAFSSVPGGRIEASQHFAGLQNKPPARVSGIAARATASGGVLSQSRGRDDAMQSVSPNSRPAAGSVAATGQRNRRFSGSLSHLRQRQKSKAKTVRVPITVSTPAIMCLLTASSASLSMLTLCFVSKIMNNIVGLQLYIPPLAAVSLIFAAEATKLAPDGTIMHPNLMKHKAIGMSITMICGLVGGIYTFRWWGATPAGRAMAIAACSYVMADFPGCQYFPPLAAMCSLYADQAMSGGPLAKLAYGYTMFPCILGTLFLLYTTRLYTSLMINIVTETKMEVADMYKKVNGSNGREACVSLMTFVVMCQIMFVTTYVFGGAFLRAARMV